MLTRQLAIFVIETKPQDISPNVLTGSRDALIDTIGCALAGSLEPISEIAVKWVRETGARGQATVLDPPLKTSPAEAAFANGIAGHALDFDDSLPERCAGIRARRWGRRRSRLREATGASGQSVLAAFAPRAGGRERRGPRARRRALPEGVARDRHRRRVLRDGRGREAVGPHRGAAPDGVGDRGGAGGGAHPQLRHDDEAFPRRQRRARRRHLGVASEERFHGLDRPSSTARTISFRPTAPATVSRSSKPSRRLGNPMGDGGAGHRCEALAVLLLQPPPARRHDQARQGTRHCARTR